MNDSLKAQCGAEFLGTGLFLFFGIGCLSALKVAGASLGLWEICIIWGLGISLAVYLTAGISGGHLNPAVTIALWLFACFPKQKVLPYIIAQFAGAFGGALLAYVLYSSLFTEFETAHHMVRGSVESLQLASIFSTYPAAALNVWQAAVERKQDGPVWVPTANTRREYAKEGKTLPAMVPAGPDNPMGLYAIYIGRLYAIHGTNANFGIGLRVSQGCIRLRNDDIKYLFDHVPVGTRVQIIDRPVKFSVEPDGSRWLEVHEPLSRNRAEFESDKKVPLPVTPVLRTFIKGDDVDTSRVNEVLERRSGMPVNISAGRPGL